MSWFRIDSQAVVQSGTIQGDCHHCLLTSCRLHSPQIEGSHMKDARPIKPRALRDALPTRALSSTVIKSLRNIQTTRFCPEGFEIFLERQMPAGIYILHAGRVKLSVTGSNGQQMVLMTALPGDVLGLSAAVSGRRHEETAVAMIPCHMGFIKCSDFLRLMNHEPEAAYWVVQLLSERVSATLERVSWIEKRLEPPVNRLQ